MSTKPVPQPILLTSRDIRILEYIAEGKSDCDIAKELCLSPKTINYHVESIKKALKVPTRIQAVVYALRNKIIF